MSRSLLLLLDGLDESVLLTGVSDEDFRLMLQIAEHEGRKGWVSQALLNVVKRQPRFGISLPLCETKSALTPQEVHAVCDLLPQEEIRIEEQSAATEESSKAAALATARALDSELVSAEAKRYDIRIGVLRELARRIGTRAGLEDPSYVSEKSWRPRGSPSPSALKAQEQLELAIQVLREQLGKRSPEMTSLGIVRADPRGNQYTAVGLRLRLPGVPSVHALWSVDEHGRKAEEE